MFGKGLESVSLTVENLAFKKLFKEVGETSVFDLHIGNKKEKVLVKEVVKNPIDESLQHVSFYKVNLKEKLKAEVPVRVVGEDVNPLAKSGEAVVLHLLSEIHVEAFPQDLPKEFVVDVSNITELGKGVTVAELSYDKSKVEILDLSPDELVVKIDKVVIREEPVEEVVETEAEAIAKVTATKELTEEEKKAKEEKEKLEKEAKENKKK